MSPVVVFFGCEPCPTLYANPEPQRLPEYGRDNPKVRIKNIVPQQDNCQALILHGLVLSVELSFRPSLLDCV